MWAPLYKPRAVLSHAQRVVRAEIRQITITTIREDQLAHLRHLRGALIPLKPSRPNHIISESHKTAAEAIIIPPLHYIR